LLKEHSEHADVLHVHDVTSHAHAVNQRILPGSPAELSRYLQMALGSASELEYHLLLARDLKILSAATHESLDRRATEVKRMLASFIQKLTTESSSLIADR
jgi:four helix bundle protein